MSKLNAKSLAEAIAAALAPVLVAAFGGAANTSDDGDDAGEEEAAPKKGRGRPAGSTNKAKAETKPAAKGKTKAKDEDEDEDDGLGDDDDDAGDLLAAFHLLSKAEERLADSEGRDEWEERNRVFHEVLIAACPSRWIKHFIGILYHQAERYRRLSLSLHPIPRDVHAEHQGIFDATMARDAETATAVLTEHIVSTFRSLKALPEMSEEN